MKYTNEHDEIITVGNCLRKQWYDHMGVEGDESRSFNLTMKANAGDVWSSYFTDRIKEAGFWYGDEVRFYNEELNLSGRVDGIIREEITGHPIGLEWKTTGTFLAKGKIRPTAAAPLAPGEDHVLQCMLYLYHWKPMGIDRWCLVYVDRDNFDMCEHIIRLEKGEDGFHYPTVSNEMGISEWKHLRLEDIIARWQELELAVVNKEIPGRDFQIQYDNNKIKALYDTGRLTKTNKQKVERVIKKGEFTSEHQPAIDGFGDWNCRFCPYAPICWKPETKKEDIAEDQLETL